MPPETQVMPPETRTRKYEPLLLNTEKGERLTERRAPTCACYMKPRTDPLCFRLLRMLSAPCCATADFKHLYKTGIAFAPKSPSNAYKFSAARNKKVGKPAKEDMDDDGVAIFWKVSKEPDSGFEATRVDFLGLDEPRENHGVLRVGLRRKSDSREFFVIGAHLSSGAEAEKEKRRLIEIRGYTVDRVGDKRGPSLLDWFKQSAEEMPTLFCLDANSEPTRHETDKVWAAMHKEYPNDSWKAKSVWDAYFTDAGDPKNDPTHEVATSNKMRGPLSDQPKKIGEPVLGVVDHIYYSAPKEVEEPHFEFVRHVFEPLTYESGKALFTPLPSLEMPSDHAPVVVDLKLPLHLKDLQDTMHELERQNDSLKVVTRCLKSTFKTLDAVNQTPETFGYKRIQDEYDLTIKNGAREGDGAPSAAEVVPQPSQFLRDASKPLAFWRDASTFFGNELARKLRPKEEGDAHARPKLSYAEFTDAQVPTLLNVNQAKDNDNEPIIVTSSAADKLVAAIRFSSKDKASVMSIMRVGGRPKDKEKWVKIKDTKILSLAFVPETTEEKLLLLGTADGELLIHKATRPEAEVPPGGSIGQGGVILDANGKPVLGKDSKPMECGTLWASEEIARTKLPLPAWLAKKQSETPTDKSSKKPSENGLKVNGLVFDTVEVQYEGDAMLLAIVGSAKEDSEVFIVDAKGFKSGDPKDAFTSVWTADDDDERRYHSKKVSGSVQAMDFKHGRVAVGGSSKSVSVYKVHSDEGNLVDAFEGKNKMLHDGSVMCLAFSPAVSNAGTGRILASGGKDHVVKIWDADTGNPRPMHRLKLGSPVTSLAFAPNGNLLATGAGDCRIKLWSPPQALESPASKAEWKMMRAVQIAAHDGEVTSLAFGPEAHRLYSGGKDGKLLENSIGTRSFRRVPLKTDNGDIHLGEESVKVRAMALIPEDQCGVDPPRGGVLAVAAIKSKKATICFYPAGLMAMEAETLKVEVLDSKRPNDDDKTRNGGGGLYQWWLDCDVYALETSPNGKYLAVGGNKDGGVLDFKWDAQTQTVILGQKFQWRWRVGKHGTTDVPDHAAKTWGSSESKVESMSFSQNETLLAVGGQIKMGLAEVYIYALDPLGLSTPERQKPPEQPLFKIVGTDIRALAFRARNPKAHNASQQSVVQQGKGSKRLSRFDAAPFLLAVSDTNYVRFFNVDVNQAPPGLVVPGSGLVPLQQSKVEVSSGQWKPVSLAEMQDQGKTRRKVTHKEAVMAIAFSCDGKLIATGSKTGRVKITKVKRLTPVKDAPADPHNGDMELELLREINYEGSAILTLAFSMPMLYHEQTMDGKYSGGGSRQLIAIAGTLGSVYVHDVETGELVRELPYTADKPDDEGRLTSRSPSPDNTGSASPPVITTQRTRSSTSLPISPRSTYPPSPQLALQDSQTRVSFAAQPATSTPRLSSTRLSAATPDFLPGSPRGSLAGPMPSRASSVGRQSSADSLGDDAPELHRADHSFESSLESRFQKLHGNSQADLLAERTPVRALVFSAQSFAFGKFPAMLAIGGDFPEVHLRKMEFDESVLKLWMCSPPPPLAQLANLLEVDETWLLWLHSRSGRTLLAHAIVNGMQPWVLKLLKKKRHPLPGASALGRDQDGLHALDHALQNHETKILRQLLPYVFRWVPPTSRVPLVEAPDGIGFLVKMAKEYPVLLAEVLQSGCFYGGKDDKDVTLDMYEAYIEQPHYTRVPMAVLKYDDGRLALRGASTDKPPSGFWEQTRDKKYWQGPKVDVECFVVGIPHLMDGNRTYKGPNGFKHPNLFKAFIETEDEDIVTSEVMRCAIAYKWGKYGETTFNLQLLLFMAFFLFYTAAMLFAIHDNGVYNFPTLGLVLFTLAFLIEVHYTVEEILEFTLDSKCDFITHMSWINVVDVLLISVMFLLFPVLWFGWPFAGILAAMGQLLMLPKAGSVIRGSSVSFIVFIIKEILTDMAPFLVVLGYVLLVSAATFLNLRGGALWAAHEDDLDLGGGGGGGGRRGGVGSDDIQEYGTWDIAIYSTFRLLLGDFDMSTYLEKDHSVGFAASIFMLLMFFVNVVCLNMLIALMSGTWTKNHPRKEYLILQGKGEQLIEYDLRMSRKRLDDKTLYPKWLHVIRKVDHMTDNSLSAGDSVEVVADDNDDGSSGASGELKMQEMQQKMQEMQETQQNMLEMLRHVLHATTSHA